MNKYKIEIEIISDTIFAAAGGGAAVDSITAHHLNGLPYIPSKTFKGLLKESAIEVQELLEKEWNKDQKDDIINVLFGREGAGNNGKLKISDGELLEVTDFSKQIKDFKLSSNEVLEYFTYIRHQTAMDNGVAKEGSLRTSRVIKPGFKFEILIGTLDETQYSLIDKACVNLRRVGTNRNRGFGKVKCNLKQVNNSTQNNVLKSKTFNIKLITPALLPTSGEDSNTVSSEKVISGRKILGMLATAYINKNSLKDADKDPTFVKLFLSGEVTYSDAYPVKKGKVCFPLGNHWVTTKEKDKVAIDYDDAKANLNWKGIGGAFAVDGSMKANVSTLIDFHNSRNKVKQDKDKGTHSRIKGSNQGDGIFYYESLAKGQEFVFQIDGHEDLLDEVRLLLSSYQELKLGKSTSTAFGQIEVSNYENEFFKEFQPEKDNVILTFVSPVILRNEYGENVSNLKGIAKALGIDTIDPKNARLRTTKVQVFQGAIKMQLPEFIAIGSGSSVLITKDDYHKLNVSSIGEFTHEGYGRFIAENEQDESKRENLLKLLQTKDSPPNPDIKTIPINKVEPLLSFVRTQREIIGSTAEAKGHKLHKNTTMLMIGLMKEVEMNLSSGFGDNVKNIINKYIETNKFSNKVIDELGNLFEFEGKRLSEYRKKNQNKFRQEFSKELTQGIVKKTQKYNSDEAKLAYWQAYFNNCKIKNRG